MNTIKKLSYIVITALMTLYVGAETKIQTVLEVANKAGQFKTLLAAIDAAGLREALSSKGPFTILAPTDDAFKALPAGTVTNLLKKENRSKLISILKYHVISGALTAKEVVANDSAATLQGSKVQITFTKGRLKINNANILDTDILAANGVIHVIDKVLIPQLGVQKVAEMKALIDFAIDKAVPIFNKGQHEACAAIYYICAKSLLTLGNDKLTSEIQEGLTSALAEVSKSHNSSKNAWTLRKILNRTYESLGKEAVQVKEAASIKSKSKTNSSFKVLLEAKLPEGFPAPGPVNEIVVKKYPVYRAARVAGSGMQNFSFMRLFGHIKKNNISMTAPVEMAVTKTDGKKRSMAFLYGNTDIGTAGQLSNGVEVIDLPSKSYVSIGLTGQDSTLVIKNSIKKLEDWLARNKEYSVDGEPRVLGYNSPMVQASKRFWEVQIPVQRTN
jgi:uncharacterized surface protein with fasciclin (FAS1) repeats